MTRQKNNKERKSSILRYPLAHRCLATYTDELDSTRRGCNECLDPKDYLITLISDTKLVTTR